MRRSCIDRASTVNLACAWLFSFLLFYSFIQLPNSNMWTTQYNRFQSILFNFFEGNFNMQSSSYFIFYFFFYPFICKMWLYYLRLTFYYCSFHILSPYKMHLKASHCCFTLVTGSPWCRCHWTNDNLNAYDIQITCYSNIQIV